MAIELPKFIGRMFGHPAAADDIRAATANMVDTKDALLRALDLIIEQQNARKRKEQVKEDGKRTTS